MGRRALRRALGEHTRAVLAEAGLFSDAEIDAMYASGAAA